MIFRILASSIYFVTWVWQRARRGCGAAVSPPGSLPLWLPQCSQPGKCYNCRVWKTSVPHTSSRDSCKEKEGAFLTSSRKLPPIRSVGHRKVGQEENKMWMGGVRGIWGPQLRWHQPSVSFWFSSWGQEGVRHEKAPKQRFVWMEKEYTFHCETRFSSKIKHQDEGFGEITSHVSTGGWGR